MLDVKTSDRLIGWAIGVLCLLPAALLFHALFNDQLGANPIEAFVRQSGVWGLRLLLVTLLVSPLAKILRQPWLLRQRRTIALWAFALVCLHLSSYLGLDKEFDWGDIFKDIVKRPYITIGMLAFAALVPLAVTSFDKIRRAMGPKKWRRLHQAIYAILPLGVLHYYLLVKADHRPPLIYAGIAAILLGWRAWSTFSNSRGRSKRAA